MKILFIGTGVMGQAILSTFSKTSKNNEIYIVNRNLNKSKEIAKKYNCNFLNSIEEIKTNKFDIYVIGVRPIDVHLMFEQIDKFDISNSLIISMVNALKIEKILNAFKISRNISIIRMSPNMNAIIGKSLTSYATFGKNEKLINFGVDFCKSFGEVFEITEDKFPSFVTLTGTSPAYIFDFLKAFEEFGNDNKYNQKFLKELIAKQFISTIENWRNNENKTEELIDEICVPNGSTIVGYEVLLEKKFNEIVIECLNKSKEKC